MSKYRKELPLVIREALKGLCDEKRQGILIYLKNKGPKSFIDISREFDISKSNLSHHLKNLIKAGLIYNFYKKNELNDKYSYYEISKLGKIIIENLKSMVISKEKGETKDLINKREKKISIEDHHGLMIGMTSAIIYGVATSSIGAKELFRLKEKDSTESKLDFYPMKFL